MSLTIDPQITSGIDIGPVWMSRNKFSPGECTHGAAPPVYHGWLVLDGSLSATISGRTVTASSGMVCFLCPSMAREVISIDGADWLSIGFQISLFGRSDFLTGYTLPAVWSPGEQSLSRLRAWMEALLDIYQSDTASARLVSEGLSRAIFGELLSGLDEHFVSDTHQSGKLMSVVRLLESDPSRNVADLARETGYSPAHFRREFRRWSNVAPHEFVVRYRIDRARRLLGGSDLSIASIAEQCGFQSVAHFTRVFHSAFGLPPAKYRNIRHSGELER